MDALLILAGLFLIAGGLVWLISLAFGTSLLWGVVSLFPPFTLVYVVRYWGVARRAVGLAGLGVIPLVVGLTMLASHDPDRLVAIASLKWLESDSQAQAHRLEMQLYGQLDGRPFNPGAGSLKDGVLTLREGDDLFARQEVRILLGGTPAEGLQVDVLPEDISPVPEVEINWMGPEQALPEARRIRSGYTLHLDLQPVPPNKMAGAFHLVLPAHYRTSLSGAIEVYTNDLRYRAGEVDLTYDSADTLIHLATDHLQRRFETRAVMVESVGLVDFPASAMDIAVHALVNGTPGTFQLSLYKGGKGWAVTGDAYPPLADEIQMQSQAVKAKSVAAPVRGSSPPVDRRQRFSLASLLRNPDRYEHLLMRAHIGRGGVAEGRFVGIDPNGNISIRRRLKGPGEAVYNLAPSDIARLELLEP